MSRPRACYNWELRRYGSGDGAGAHLPPNGVAAVAAACGAASGGRSLSLTSTGDSRFLFGICPCFFWFSPWHTIDISRPMGTDLCFLTSETEKSDTPEPRAAEKSEI